MYLSGKKIAATLPLMLMFGIGAVTAQEPNPTSVGNAHRGADVIQEGPNGIFIYHVKVVQRDLDAVNYLNRRDATHVDFVGTD
ncbi:MAG: OmpA family protein, partial [Acidobacteriaceae bacterium]